MRLFSSGTEGCEGIWCSSRHTFLHYCFYKSNCWLNCIRQRICEILCCSDRFFQPPWCGSLSRLYYKAIWCVIIHRQSFWQKCCDLWWLGHLWSPVSQSSEDLWEISEWQWKGHFSLSFAAWGLRWHSSPIKLMLLGVLTNPSSLLCLSGTGWSSGSVGRMSQWRWGHWPLRPKFRWVRLVIFLLYYYCPLVLFLQSCLPFSMILFEFTPRKIIWLQYK